MDMREKMMLKIGEFARIGQVSIATLRHYEKAGLLKPTALDAETGYRYYLLDQLPRLNRILALKDLGFSLEQIARLLEGDLDVLQLRGMFVLKQAQTQQLIETEQARLTRIAARLQQIEQEGIMPTYDVRLKEVDPVLVASMRELVPLGENLGRAYSKIVAYLSQQRVQPLQPTLLLLHSSYEWHNDQMAIDVETAVPVPTALPENEQISTRTVSGGWMASTVHTGNDLSMGKAFVALYNWIKDNEYHVIGTPRLIHLQRAEYLEPSQYVTEVQFPIERQREK
jgi:DNA-binding transcriptional MerR regulator